MSASRATPRSARRRFHTTLLLPLVPLALTLAACGGDDGASSITASSTETTPAVPEPVDTGAESADLTDTATVDTAAVAGDGSTPQIGNGLEVLEGEITDDEMAGALDALEALGIDTRMGIITEALGARYEITSDSTATIFVDGDVDVDGFLACFTVGFLSSPDDVVTVVYPNGEVVCD